MVGTALLPILVHFPAPLVYQGLRALWWTAGRRVILTSVPKCGTHLLRRLLNVIGMPAVRQVIAENTETATLLYRELEQARGDALVCHLHGRPIYHAIAREFDARVVFITRDPRDQVVSHAFHYRTHTDHPLHPFFRDQVPVLDDALMATIRGFGPGPYGHLDNVATFYNYFLPWKDMDGVCHTTFERLVGAAGGGSETVQVAEVHDILQQIGFPISAGQTAPAVAAQVFSPASPTFRMGQVGAWRAHFGPQHKDAFKEVAGQLLIDLGYERDLGW